MQTATNITELRSMIKALRQTASTVGFVPTMGALHEGHLSLVRQSRAECPATLVSIFVNPTQFGPDEDLAAYPRTIEEDLRLLDELGVDLVYLPSEAEMYPPGFSTYIQPPAVADGLEGEHRPGHFRGVATVVLKLFQVTGADVAYFGQKDYQQSLVIRHMVRDLNLPVDIRVCPIVRDTDGLALSSRNVYLSDEQRTIALSLYHTLSAARELVLEGCRDGQVVMEQMRKSLMDAGVTRIEYAVVADAESLEIQDNLVAPPAVLLIAAYVGSTRLIDNLLLED